MLNKILILCDKEEIKQIKEFKIIREDLLKVDGIKFFNNNQFLFDHFFHKHNDLGNYQKHRIKSYIITIIRIIIKKCGLELNHYKKSFYINKSTKYEIIYYV